MYRSGWDPTCYLMLYDNDKDRGIRPIAQQRHAVRKSWRALKRQSISYDFWSYLIPRTMPEYNISGADKVLCPRSFASHTCYIRHQCRFKVPRPRYCLFVRNSLFSMIQLYLGLANNQQPLPHSQHEDVPGHMHSCIRSIEDQGFYKFNLC